MTQKHYIVPARTSSTTRLAVLTLMIVASFIIDLAGGQVSKQLQQKAAAVEKSYRVKSDIYHHGLGANQSIPDAVWGSRRYALVTNHLGFKDATPREVPLKISNHRIVFIGDSFTEGVGVDYPDTYVGRIAAALKDQNVDVLNAAVAGYSPMLYLAKIRHLVEDLGLTFDELFVAIDISDPSDDIGYHKIGKYETDRPATPKASVQGVKDFISENTVLTHFVLKQAKDLVEPPRDTESWRSRWTDEGGYLNHHTLGLELNSKNMNELAALMSQKGIRLTVAVYPHPRQIRAGKLDSPPVTHWRQWASEHGAGFVDLFPRFINQTAWHEVVDTYFIPGDVHLNENGHAIFADAFLEYIGSRDRPRRK